MGRVIDFGPRGLRGADETSLLATDANDPFLLSTAEWLTIQVYTRGAAGLPINEALMRQHLNMAATDSIAPFQRIIDVYKDIYAHCKTWDEITFPETVRLAGDVVNYSQMAPAYFSDMIPEAEKLVTNPADAEAKSKLIAILQRLSDEARAFAARAEDVSRRVTQFANDTKKDQVTIQGADGVSGLVGEYRRQFGATSEEGRRLERGLAEANRLLQQAIAEHNHNTILAATTPTYAWVPIFGWIVAPTVAGVYTKKALAALEAQQRTRAEIGRLEGTRKRNATLIGEIERATMNISIIREQLNAALPAIQRIQGTWDAMAQDFGYLTETLIDGTLADTVELLPGLTGPDVENAINQWKALGMRAEVYRTNAFVHVARKVA